jgi:hypothetical protein
MEKIIEAIKRFGRLIRLWLWEKPIDKPIPEKKYVLKLTDVAREYVVVMYHGQKVNLHQTEVPIWNMSSRKDKRAMADRFKTLEKKGYIKFVEIDGKWICVKNKNYQALAEQKKEKK